MSGVKSGGFLELAVLAESSSCKRAIFRYFPLLKSIQHLFLGFFLFFLHNWSFDYEWRIFVLVNIWSSYCVNDYYGLCIYDWFFFSFCLLRFSSLCWVQCGACQPLSDNCRYSDTHQIHTDCFNTYRHKYFLSAHKVFPMKV